MILAAGFGTRLAPLTNTTPKALVEVNGRPMISWVIAQLIAAGVTEIVVNTHHFSEQLAAFVDNFNLTNTKLKICISSEHSILDTGGGICNASWFFNDEYPFIVHNTDIFSTVNIRALYENHLQIEHKYQAMTSLAVQKRDSNRALLFSKDEKEHSWLCGWENTLSQERKNVRTYQTNSLNSTRLPFMGIQVISPKLFKATNLQPPFSLVELYLQAAENGAKIFGALQPPETLWMDLGRPEQLEAARDYFTEPYFSRLDTYLK